MTTIVAFAQLVLGFVPILLIVASAVAALWITTKVFPNFGARLNATYDALMGTDADYDWNNKTGYTTPRRW